MASSVGCRRHLDTLTFLHLLHFAPLASAGGAFVVSGGARALLDRLRQKIGDDARHALQRACILRSRFDRFTGLGCIMSAFERPQAGFPRCTMRFSALAFRPGIQEHVSRLRNRFHHREVTVLATDE